MHDGCEVLPEVVTAEIAFPECLLACLKVRVPAQAVHLPLATLSLDHEAEGAHLGALRRVRDPRREHEEIPFVDVDQLPLALLDRRKLPAHWMVSDEG